MQMRNSSNGGRLRGARRLLAALLPLVVCGAIVPALNCNLTVTPGTSGATFMLAINASDPLLAMAKTSGGQTIECYGSRDNTGSPASFNRIIIRDADGGVTNYMVDDQGRPTHMTAPNGTQITLSWQSATVAALTAVSPDGTTQVNTLVDFASQSGSSRIKGAAPPLLTPEDPMARGAMPVTLSFRPGRAEFAGGPKGHVAAKADLTDANVVVNVTLCGSPSPGVDVFVTARNTLGDPLGQFPAVDAGNGVFKATIPTSLASSINPADICQSVASKLGLTCDWLLSTPGAAEYLCVQLGAALAAAGVSAPAAGPVAGGCLAVTEGLRLYCATLGASAAPGAPSLADSLCQAQFLNRTFEGDIALYAEVTALPSNATSATVTVPGKGPFPALAVDLGSMPAVRTLSLQPEAPSAGHEYVANANVFCLPTGTVVKLSVVGTDGYANSTTTTVSATQRDGTFMLGVPGAGTSGIMDTVTLSVTPPGMGALTRTASLVFQ